MTRGLLALVVGVVCMPVQARAEAYVNPWAGVIFNTDQAAKGVWSFGAALGDAGGSVWGTESSVGLTPGFFGSSSENYVMDLMAGISVGPTFSFKNRTRWRPYGVGGFGVIRTSIDAATPADKFARNDFGYSLGAGLTALFGEHVGVRGDVRYFRALSGDDVFNSLGVHLDDFRYWRTAIGLVLH